MKTSHSFALFTVACVALVTDAQADIKSFHPAECQERYPRVMSSNARNSYYRRGPVSIQADDIGGNYSDIICALTRDRIYASTVKVVVEYYNSSHTTYGLSCALWAQSEDVGGEIYDWESKSTTSLNTKGQFSYENVTAYNGNEGSYALTCQMGEDDELYHIYVNEGGGSN